MKLGPFGKETVPESFLEISVVFPVVVLNTAKFLDDWRKNPLALPLKPEISISSSLRADMRGLV